jgi:hypothetical protein
LGGWIGYEMAGFIFGDYLFSMYWYGVSSFSGSIWLILFLSSLMSFILVLYELDTGQ